jgi:hypothetical protein
MKKFKFKHPTDKMLIFILVLIIGLLTSILGFFGWRINLLESSVYCKPTENSQQSCLGWFPIKVYIQDAVKGVYADEGVVDAKENRVYFPELRVYLPLSQPARDLRYNHTAGDNSDSKNPWPEQSQFTSFSTLNTPLQDWNDIPCIQQEVTVSINAVSQTDQTASGSLKLNDGRTLYFYENTDKSCQVFWNGNQPNQIVQLLKQAKSY